MLLILLLAINMTRAKKIKDMSAGAVLIVSLIAVVAGIYVFGPPLLAPFRSW